MKKLATLLLFSLFTVGAFSQAFTGVSWVAWGDEPDYEGVAGYADNPYQTPVLAIPMNVKGVVPANISDAATFDAAWDLLGDEQVMAKMITDGSIDFYDLDGDRTFGASWKGMHDGSNLYIFAKYYDTNAQLDAGTHNFEVMVQPTSHKRHEATFQAAADSAEEWQMAYQNMAYARYVELGGGKAHFMNGIVDEYAASVGLDKSTFWNGCAVGSWGANEHGLKALAMANHFWDLSGGVIRCILVMSFDGALGYPADPTNLEGDYNAVAVGDTISFDIKSRGTKGENSLEYHWASDVNNCYASNYYAGHLILAEAAPEPGDIAMAGVSWVIWTDEPDYEDMSSYADNPYDKPKVDILQAPDSWTYEGITDAESFDVTWNLLGDENLMNKMITDGTIDFYDLDSDKTFGASWKGVHDGTKLYILSKYYDTNSQLDAGTHNFEVMVQPTSIERHENTFSAAADSTEDWQLAYQNMAYARYVELGGGKAHFMNGLVDEYAASIGLDKSTFWNGCTVGNWGANEHGLEGLAMANHFWDVTDGVIRSVLVMSFDGALGYPADPTNLEGDYNAVAVGDSISFDIKSRGTKGESSLEYHWSSDRNNCYASNYYAGVLTLSDKKIVVEGIENHFNSDVKAFVYMDQLHIRGIESVNLSIYSTTGSLLKSARNVSGTLDMSDLRDGIYIVKLEGIATAFKIVK